MTQVVKLVAKLSTVILISFMCFSLSAQAEEKSASRVEKIGEFLGAKDATHPTWFKESFLDLEEDIADAAENNKRLVIYFWQPGCPYCDQLWSENFADPKMVETFRKHFDIVALNMWGSRDIVSVGGNDYTEKTFATALGIKYTPTLLFFDENNKVIHQLNGYVPVENFKKTVKFVSGKHEKTTKYSAFALSTNDVENSDTAKQFSGLHQQDFITQPLHNLDRSNSQPMDPKTEYTLVLFEEENCKNCDLLHQKTLQDKTTRDLAKQFSVVQLNRYSNVNVITPTGSLIKAKDWATELDIEYLPAMIFFDESGKQVMRIDTQLRTFHVQSILDYVLSGSYKTEPSFQRYISARVEHIRETGKDVDIFAY